MGGWEYGYVIGSWKNVDDQGGWELTLWKKHIFKHPNLPFADYNVGISLSTTRHHRDIGWGGDSNSGVVTYQSVLCMRGDWMQKKREKKQPFQSSIQLQWYEQLHLLSRGIQKHWKREQQFVLGIGVVQRTLHEVQMLGTERRLIELQELLSVTRCVQRSWFWCCREETKANTQRKFDNRK